MKYYLAIDIGASSGRHIVGWREGGAVKTEEVYRFPNGVTGQDGHLVWDVDVLLAYVKEGIDRALERFPDLESLSVDTWGVDYVLLRGDGEVRPCYAYRDSRTEAVIPAVHEKIPFAELYARTGCQFQPFNTVYQLYDDLRKNRLDGVTDFLMIPEYLMWKLTGVKAREYTNATTTGMVNAKTGEFDLEIVRRLGLPVGLFPELSQSGTVVGEYKGIKVVLCATHDTASAVEGILAVADVAISPIRNAGRLDRSVAPALPTRSFDLVGLPQLYIRLRDELCPDTPFPDLVAEARASAFEGTVDANAPEFLAPESMKAAFDGALSVKPETVGDYFRCAYRSLAIGYRDAIRELEANTGKGYDKLYIVDGGAKNVFLNELTAAVTGKEVVALPIEATALGNLKIQMEK